MTWELCRPHPVVQPLFSRYIGYEQHDVGLPVHRGLPSRHVTVIISLQDSVRVSGRFGVIRASGLVGGLHTNAVLIDQDRTQCGIHLELHPFGVRTLFGVDACELGGQVVALDDLGPPVWARLPERLASTATWSDRFGILDEVLAPPASEPAPTAPQLRMSWQLMLTSGGQMRVADIAKEVGWSRRHFTEQFRAETGLTPKQATRIVRFERAGALLRTGKLDLAGIAVDCGYYDQAHLSNEWHALAGCSPRTWISEELPFLQDDDFFAGANWPS